MFVVPSSCQSIIMPEHHHARASSCQSIIMPEHHHARASFMSMSHHSCPCHIIHVHVTSFMSMSKRLIKTKAYLMSELAYFLDKTTHTIS
jgi:hypothetical protein